MTHEMPILSRIIDVTSLAAGGDEHRIASSAEERAALAKMLQLPSIEALEASLTVEQERGGVIHVHGELTAAFQQVCTVTIEPFETTMREPVDIRFAPPEKVAAMAAAAVEDPEADDLPDPYEDDQIDLGAVVQEFFVLGLDPYPRKPGAVFDYSDENDEKLSPFAKLAALTPSSKH